MPIDDSRQAKGATMMKYGLLGSEYAVLQYNGYYRQIWTNGLTIVAHLSFQKSKGGRYGFSFATLVYGGVLVDSLNISVLIQMKCIF